MNTWWWRQARQGTPVRSLDEKFTDLADAVSEAMGRWKTSAACFCLIAVWAAFGPATGYSDSWQLWVNTPTTVVELFLGLFTLAAANRVEKRMWHVLRHIETMVGDEAEDLETEQANLAAIARDLTLIKERLQVA